MIFVDTSVFLALWFPEERHHRDVVAAWDSLKSLPDRLFTSNLIIAETATLVARRAGARYAAARVRSVMGSSVTTVLRPEEKDEQMALAFFEKYAEQEVSFTDAMSFALMRAHRIKRAFTLDAHFERAGFMIWPSVQ